MFTPLQELVLSHAEGLTHKLESQLFTLARKYEYASDMRNTPENDVHQTVRELQKALDALLKDKK